VIYPSGAQSAAVAERFEPTVTRGLVAAGADDARPDSDTLFGDGGPVEGEPQAVAGPDAGPATAAEVSGTATQAPDDADPGEAFEEVFEEDGDEDQDVFGEDYTDGPSRGRRVLRGLAVLAESVFALAFGAGLFLAFDELWTWNSLVAMVLAVLVTLGLVAGVWAVRKTEDITSTLFAVGVGLLVTFGPLALMHAS
jgi:hypothetical protein